MIVFTIQRRPALVAVVIMGLVALSTTGCGSRWNKQQRAAVLGRYQARTSSAPEAAASDVPAGEGDTSTASPGAAAGGVEATSPNEPGSSAATGPSGAARAQTATGATARPCTAPSHENGVTDTQLVVGEISSESGPVPGLGASAAAAVRAQVALRNARGGVCGRKVVLREADDGTDAGRYREAIRGLNPNVLGLSGGFAVGDIGAESVINELKIPIINSPTGRTGQLRWVFDINPDFARPNVLIGKYKYLFDRGARKVSMTYIAVDQSRIEANIQRHLMEAAGLKVVHVNELPLSTLSYDAAARAAANSGANYLWFIADTNGQASMARSVYDTHHDWLFKEFSYTTYGTNFIELAGKAAEGATSWLRSLPTEEASTNEAMHTYVEWMNRVAQGLPQDLFSIDSYVSANAFFDALEALPGAISREALVRQLETFDSYDAGGMFAPINLGKDLSKGCFMAMIVHNGKWQRLAPTPSGYLC